MIQFDNGHEVDLFAASGALAYLNGYWWEQPFRWLGLIRPQDLVVITKTLTLAPTRGNLKMWCPWRCVRLIEGGTVNAVGLTNPGLEWWLSKYPPILARTGRKVVVSIMPYTADSAATMAKLLKPVRTLVAIQFNASCPNVIHEESVDWAVRCVEAMRTETDQPIIVKLGYHTDQSHIATAVALAGKVAALELINAVSWPVFHEANQLRQRKIEQIPPSPLAQYGLVGGVSGMPIAGLARQALVDAKGAGVRTPIISGGGIYDLAEMVTRQHLGASALSLGTVFLRQPWKPRAMVRAWRSRYDGSGAKGPN